MHCLPEIAKNSHLITGYRLAFHISARSGLPAVFVGFNKGMGHTFSVRITCKYDYPHVEDTLLLVDSLAI